MAAKCVLPVHPCADQSLATHRERYTPGQARSSSLSFVILYLSQLLCLYCNMATRSVQEALITVQERVSEMAHQPIEETFTTFRGELLTRNDFQRACTSLLLPLVPFFSPLSSCVKIGATGTRFDEIGAQLEGFARPLWGLAALLAGEGELDAATCWIEGLRQGTDPESPEYWGACRDTDQRMVEMCPIGFALAVAGDLFFAKCTDREKENVGNWLKAINMRQMPNTNWLWFRVFANLGLMKNGLKYDAEKMEKDLDHLDTFYRGDGWSNDGPDGYTQMDSYSGSFAIQYLQLLYAKLNGDKDPKRADTFRERARTFALDAIHYYDPQGRHITFGRSLTYRFAMAGFWSAVAFADLELPAPITWGVVKGLLLRNCRWWMSQKEMLSPQGTLTIGYSYPNQFISENYNSPGSPYWFMLSFVSLACPEAHPFWLAQEEALPSTSLPSIKPLKQPLHIMVSKAGHTFLLSAGQMCHYPVRAGAAKYGKFAYSSAFAYSVPTGEYSIEAAGVDNTLALSDDVGASFGESWRVKRVATDARIETLGGTPCLVSGWSPWPDVTVDTWLIPPTDAAPLWHMRVHRVRTARKLRAVEGAWAVHGYSSTDGRELAVLEEHLDEGRSSGSNAALAVSLKSGAVGIRDLREVSARHGRVLDADANSNLYWSRSVIPTLFDDIEAGGERWYATAVFALPESVLGWREAWKEGWARPPTLPEWVVDMIR